MCTETYVVLPHGCQNTEDKAEAIQTCTDHRIQDCLSGHLPREMGSDNHTELHVTSCSGFKWNSHMLRIVKVSFKGEEQTVVHPQWELPFSDKEIQLTATCNRLDTSQRRYTDWEKEP